MRFAIFSPAPSFLAAPLVKGFCIKNGQPSTNSKVRPLARVLFRSPEAPARPRPSASSI